MTFILVTFEVHKKKMKLATLSGQVITKLNKMARA